MEGDQNQNDDAITRFSLSWPLTTYLEPELWNRTKLIRNSMTCPFGKTLLVTSTVTYPCPDFIVKALSAGFRGVKIIHTWKPVDVEAEDSKCMWSGSVAFYKEWKDLKKAAEHITREYEDIQALWFRDFVYLLIIAERSHPLFDVGSSKVIIEGPRLFKETEYSGFMKMLREFGQIATVSFSRKKKIGTFWKMAVAEYRFATHAFVAKFQLDGMKYQHIGILRAKVVMTEKEVSVKHEVLRRFAEHMKTLP